MDTNFLNQNLSDPKRNFYCKMYGAVVKNKFDPTLRGVIVKKPQDPFYSGVIESTVFIRLNNGSIVHFIPEAFIQYYEIIESSSLSAIDIRFGHSVDAEEALNRMRAIIKLKNKES